MSLEGYSVTFGVSSSVLTPSASGEIDSAGVIDFLAFSGTALSDKSLSLINLSSKNSASRALMMELVPRSRNLQASLFLI